MIDVGYEGDAWRSCGGEVHAGVVEELQDPRMGACVFRPRGAGGLQDLCMRAWLFTSEDTAVQDAISQLKTKVSDIRHDTEVHISRVKLAIKELEARADGPKAHSIHDTTIFTGV